MTVISVRYKSMMRTETYMQYLEREFKRMWRDMQSPLTCGKHILFVLCNLIMMILPVDDASQREHFPQISATCFQGKS
ncbi:hypothetical protein IEQ34_019684 [Dendrobium chrysotoxum]|uniref:Uncharacterized protein n=1 Tax=Dendrobium chrysotoxum TaxID=161865 RepID=A0AAV7FRX6_DENCH|nr:hypothetical protein IEQ34_019684 [Dendrobium chrysotoxum]